MQYTVVKGKKLGRKIGFPTMNLEPAKLSQELDYGVYTCEVLLVSEKNIYSGILHFGPRKTLNDEIISLEIHLFDFKKEVYGEKVKLKIGEKIRGIQKFENLDELKKQIELDIAKVKCE